MIKNDVVIEKKNNQISFFSCSEKYGRNYLYSKPFTLGEYLYFKDDRSMNELRAFHDWGKNPRLDKTVKRVLKMCKYIEKDMEAYQDYVPQVMKLGSSKTSIGTYDYCR